MKKITLIYFIVLIHSLSYAQTLIVPHDSLKKGDGGIYTYKEKLFTGKSTYISESGKKFECEFKDGKEHGWATEYNKEGNIKSKQKYINGKAYDEINYFKSGSMYSEKYYTGTNFFSYKKYNENGKIIKQSIWKDGKETGTEFDDEGKKLNEYVWENGDYTQVKSFDDSGILLNGFGGYWMAQGKTFATAIHIIKNLNLYTVEHFTNKNSPIKIKQNNVVQNGRLNTGQGSYQYIEGNDIIIDQSLEPGVIFKRITKRQWIGLTTN